MRSIIHFGQRLRGDDLPHIPDRFRGVGGLSGRVAGIRLRPSTGDAWLQLEGGMSLMGQRAPAKTIPLHGRESATPVPTSDVCEIRGGMRVLCHDGLIGRIEGFAVNGDGLVESLVVRIRGDMQAAAEQAPRHMSQLVSLAGLDVLLPAPWIQSAKDDADGRRFLGRGGIVHLDAAAEQVASAEVLRADADIAADVWKQLQEDPALAPYTGRMRLSVTSGELTLRGRLPSQRHRATAEQNAWHVPGVAAIHNEIEVGA